MKEFQKRIAPTGITVAQHVGWRRYYLKMARSAVGRREWLAASDFYRSAAFHASVVGAMKQKRR